MNMKGTFIFMVFAWGNTISAEHLFIPGHLILGGLFPIHGSIATNINGQSICDKNIQYEYGIQPLEAMIFSVKLVNELNILGNVKLGMLVYDYCGDPHIARVKSLNFFKAASEKLSDFTCVSHITGNNETIAVIGLHSSDVSKEIAGMMSALSMPLISYMATSSFLSDKTRYPHFFRTVPNDKYVVDAIIKILSQLKWNYVSVVYSSSVYGISGYETLIKAKEDHPNICFGPSYMITSTFEDEDYADLLRNLNSPHRPRVVILFTERQMITKISIVAQRTNTQPSFTWIVSDSVIHKRQPVNRARDRIGFAFEGALLVQPKSSSLKGFDAHFKEKLLQKPNITNNTWFDEFIDQYVDCYRKGSCTDEEQEVTYENFKENRYLNYIQDAVYAVAHAIRNAIMSKCNGKPDKICNYTSINRLDILAHLRNVNFTVTNEEPQFKFVDETDGPVRYTIQTVRKEPNTVHLYGWIEIGHYYGSTMTLELNRTQLKYRHLDNNTWQEYPKSFCSCEQNCAYHQISTPVEVDSTCYICKNCAEFHIIVEGECELCPDGEKPNSNRSSCEPIPEDPPHFSSVWVICSMTVAVSGFGGAVIGFCLFVVYRATPLVRASGPDSSYISFVGIMMSCLMTFILTVRPTTAICFLTRLGVGISFTLCYASLVTRIIRIHRIFNNGIIIRGEPRYTSPRAQVITTGILTLIELLIIIIWMIAIPSETAHVYPTRDTKLKICVELNDSTYLIGFAYPFALIVISTVYAIKSRKCPDGFKEAAHIGFTNYTTIILWLAFVPLYLTREDYKKRITLALSLSLSGWIELICLYVPKIYILLFRPEKNVEALVPTSKRSIYNP